MLYTESTYSITCTCTFFIVFVCRALSDANSALKIDTTWAKGYFRKGRALAGLKVREKLLYMYISLPQLLHVCRDDAYTVFYLTRNY